MHVLITSKENLLGLALHPSITSNEKRKEGEVGDEGKGGRGEENILAVEALVRSKTEGRSCRCVGCAPHLPLFSFSFILYINWVLCIDHQHTRITYSIIITVMYHPVPRHHAAPPQPLPSLLRVELLLITLLNQTLKY